MRPADRPRSRLRDVLRRATEPDEELVPDPPARVPVFGQKADRLRTGTGRPRQSSFPAHKRHDLNTLRRVTGTD